MTALDLAAVQRRAERVLAVADPYPHMLDEFVGAAHNLARQTLALVAEVVSLREQVERMEYAYAVIDAERMTAVEALGRARDAIAKVAAL